MFYYIEMHLLDHSTHTNYMSVSQPKVSSLPNTFAPATMATDHKLVTCHNQPC
jgi:hypothetical protein